MVDGAELVVGGGLTVTSIKIPYGDENLEAFATQTVRIVASVGLALWSTTITSTTSRFELPSLSPMLFHDTVLLTLLDTIKSHNKTESLAMPVTKVKTCKST
jgi:hypothetical protein